MIRRLKLLACACPIAILVVLVGTISAPAAVVTGSASGATPEFEAGTVLVGFTSGTSDLEARRVVISIGAQDVETIGAGTHRLRVASGKVSATIAALRTHRSVRYAEPNYVVRAILTPNDTRFGELWAMNNTGQVVNGTAGTAGADIRAPLAWDLTTGNKTVVVGVVDTGIDYGHPDLSANVWSSATVMTYTIGGVTITCAAGTHGFNAITGTCDPADDNNHGSHVSGTIGAVGNNGTGVAGVNWTTNLMGLKFLSARGSGTLVDAIDAIEFAVQAKIAGVNVRALNNSWGGGGFSQALLDEINRAGANDILFVAAAGNSASNNDTFPFYPAAYNAAGEIAVAATDQNDRLATFSNFGPTSVQLGAPGTNILSTIVGGGYAFFNGTSMATPHVTGSAALVLSRCTQTTAQVKAAILNNVDPLPSLSGLVATGGRLNVNKAVRSCQPDFSVSIDPATQTVNLGQQAAYTVTVSGIAGFSGTVALTATGIPAGSGSATLNPTSVTLTASAPTATSTLTASANPGSYTLAVTGASGAISHSATTTLTVLSPDFSVSVSPGAQSIGQGQTASYTVTVSAIAGFVGTVTLAAGGIPAGSGAATLSPTSVTLSAAAPTATSTLTASANPGSYSLTVAGASGALSHQAGAALTVVAADFGLSVSPAVLSVDQGITATYVVTITSTGGFTGAVNLTASGIPAGTWTFSPNPASGGSSTLSVATAAMAPGVYTVTITGTSGSLSHSVTASLEVLEP